MRLFGTSPAPKEVKKAYLPEAQLLRAKAFNSSISHIKLFEPGESRGIDWQVSSDPKLEVAYGLARESCLKAAMDETQNTRFELLNATQKEAGRIINGAIAQFSGLDGILAGAETAFLTLMKQVDVSRARGWNVMLHGDIWTMAGVTALYLVNPAVTQRHIEYAEECIQVWQCGLGRAGDVNGVQYVFCAGEPGTQPVKLRT